MHIFAVNYTTMITTISQQIAIAFGIGILFGWVIGLLINDAKHDKLLKEQFKRNEELEKLLSNKN
jgi:hypothetical protein